MQDDKVQYILSDLIDLPEKQMRRDLNRDELHDLSENIKTNGLINPITVRPVGNRFELVAGQRRLLACGIARIIRIPCIVRDLSDESAMDVMAAENLERRDVDLVDEARFIALVMKEQNQSISQMSERLNRGEQYVKDRLAVAEMPDYMQNFLKSGELKLGVALHLMSIEPEEKRRVWVGMALEQNITVRTAEYWAYQHKIGTLPSAAPTEGVYGEAPANEPRPIMFIDELDGTQHPPEEMMTFMIFKGNAQYVHALGVELRAAAGESESESGGGGEPTPVGAAAEALGLGDETSR